MVQVVSAVHSDQEAPCSVRLLGGFEVRAAGRFLELPRAAERLVAYLALQEATPSRCRVATTLWPDASEERSLGCLRSALWRVRTASRTLLQQGPNRLGLGAQTFVDTAELTRGAVDADDRRWEDIPLNHFGAELLPDWDEEWVLIERERLRQISLCGLEALSRQHLASGRIPRAVETAWRAITLEPLQESAHQALIDAHLALGNVGEAVRSLRSLQVILRRELGIEANTELVRQVRMAVASRRSSNGSPGSVAVVVDQT